eukprot:TRINITY_DN2797_c0_g3_i1.p7 TRINITY_DN2797_c0_g3~~TRINITY_DN2797_c0_g3_i1.p7  ORF type:complete len:104 (+),score=45.05 TRINITY_DN2797_c0_g3_i1:1497-1808(+)
MTYGSQRIVCTPQVGNVLLMLNEGEVDIEEYCRKVKVDEKEFVDYLFASEASKLVQIGNGKASVNERFREVPRILYLGQTIEKDNKKEKEVVEKLLKNEKKIM